VVPCPERDRARTVKVLVGGAEQDGALAVLRDRHGFTWVSSRQDLAGRLRGFALARGIAIDPGLAGRVAGEALGRLSEGAGTDVELACDRYDALRWLMGRVGRVCIGYGLRAVPEGARDSGWWIARAGHWPLAPPVVDLFIDAGEDARAAIDGWMTRICPRREE
jgi:hypothetical protein